MRTRGFHSLLIASALALLALAQLSCGGSRSAGGAGDRKGPSEARSQAGPTPQAGNVAMAAQALLQAVRERGRGISPKARSRVEAGLEEVAEQVDKTARTDAATVVHRMALEFGVPVDTLMSERTELGAPWSDLVIAHTLQANTTSGMTARQLLKLHDDGTGWSQIAHGLGLDLSQVVRAVKIECRVAAGLERPDGKVAVIRSDGSVSSAGLDGGTS